MRRLSTVGKLYGVLLLALAALVLMAAQGAQAAPRPPQAAQSSLLANPAAPSLINSPTAITCTLNNTTTDSLGSGNQSFATAAILSNYSGLALAVGNQGNVVQLYDDYFVLNSASPNVTYTVQAIPDGVGNYNLGMIVYNASFTPIYTDVNAFDNNANLAIVFSTASLSGPWYYKVFQLTPITVCGGTYHLAASFAVPPTNTPTPSLTPTPTKTSTPTRTITPTPLPFGCQATVDRFEPNNDFDSATTIGLGVKYANLNFVQCVYDDGSWDNDFFKVRVKPGMLVTCKTLELSAGTDTNLILYDDSRNGIGGSDDVNRAAGDLSSAVTYYVTYEGWLYGLVGQGFSVPQNLESAFTYSYECYLGSLATDTSTPTSTPAGPTRTPRPEDTSTPTITPTPTPPFIQIHPLPTATPVGLPLTQIPVSLQVYYDADANNKADPGEGVSGVSARIFDLVTGDLLIQGFTDGTGRATFTVNAPGAVHLVVPYFNFSAIILPSGGSAVIRISPRALPQSIP